MCGIWSRSQYQTETHCEGHGSESCAVVCLRQTSGQLLEAALGKGIASGGCLKSATPFSTPSVDAITDRLHSLSDSSQMHVCQKCKNAASVIQQSVASDRKIRGPYGHRVRNTTVLIMTLEEIIGFHFLKSFD